MSFAIKTAGFQGQDRDFTMLGLDAWPAAESAWMHLGDLDSFGVFAFGDGEQWEIRVAGLDADRRDAHNRLISNTLVFRGGPEDEGDATRAIQVAMIALTKDGRMALETKTAEILTSDLVESLFIEDVSVVAVTPVLDDLTSTMRQDWGDLPHEPGAWRVGSDHRDDPLPTLIATLRRIACGEPGLLAFGTIYTPEQLPPLVAENLLLCDIDSTRGWEDLISQGEPQDDPSGGQRPKAERTISRALIAAIVLLITLACLLIWVSRRSQ